jgi:hypothetical protein
MEECPHFRHTLGRKVIDDARLESDVRVDDESRAEHSVGDGIKGARGERSDGKRYQGSGY